MELGRDEQDVGVVACDEDAIECFYYFGLDRVGVDFNRWWWRNLDAIEEQGIDFCRQIVGCFQSKASAALVSRWVATER